MQLASIADVQVLSRGIAIAWLVGAAAAAHAGPVRGTVYADADGDGRRTEADPPIAGAVVVFEDELFTRTEVDGTFALETPGGGQVWVRAPDGFSPAPVWTTVSFAGATGVELLLAPRPVALPLTFIHASDLHVGVVDAADLDGPLRQAIDRDPTPHFVIATGDLTQSGTATEFTALRGAIGRIDVPFVPVVGNHDWASGGTTYRAQLGPPAYSFDAGGAHFVVLHGNESVEERIAFVRRDLALVSPGTLVLAFIHYPITLPFDQVLFDGLVAAGVTHLFTGHFHASRTVAFDGLTEHNVQPLAMGGIPLVPAGYSVVTVDGGEVRTTTEFVVDTPVFAVLHPPDGEACVASVPEVVVAYAGGPQPVELTASLDGVAVPLAPAGGWDFAGAPAAPVEPGEHALSITATARGVQQTITRRFCVWDEAPRPAPGADWSQLGGGPAHTGAIDAAIDPPLDVAWTRRIGGFLRGAPVYADGRLYVPVVGYGNHAAGGVVALDAATGTPLWSALDTGPVDAPLAIDGDQVIAAGVDGVVRAFGAETGDLRWERDLGEDLPPQARSLHAGPTIAAGTIYAGHMYRFAAIDAGGRVRWQIAPSAATFPSFGESTVVASADRVAGVFGFGDEGVLGLATATGGESWRFADGIMAGTLAPLAIASDHVVVATGRGDVAAIDLAGGAEAWRTTLVPGGFDYALWLRAAPAVAGDQILVAGQRDGLYAIASADGTPRWSYVPSGTGPLRTVHYEATSGAFSSAPVVTGDVVWIGGDDGVLRALDAATGAHRWSIDLGAPILAGLVPTAADDGGALYVATWDGTVRALVTPDSPSADPPPGTGCGCGAQPGASQLPWLLALALSALLLWPCRRGSGRGRS